MDPRQGPGADPRRAQQDMARTPQDMNRPPQFRDVQAIAQPPRTEVRHSLPEVNWDYAVIERLNRNDLTTRLIPFNLGKAVMEGDPQHNLTLEPGDVVTIFSKDDIEVPVAKQTMFVRLEFASRKKFSGTFISAVSMM